LNDVNNGKPMGVLRFRSEKAKTLSLPENNILWREMTKKKMKGNYLLSIEQISYYVVARDELSAVMPILFFTVGNSKTPFTEIVDITQYNPENAKLLAAQRPI
jgi:hypothetical protein